MSEPKEYVPRDPVVAMKVEQPYKRVAEWCGGEVLRRFGRGSTVLGIVLNAEYGERMVARPGDYVAQDPISPHLFTKYEGGQFEKYFVEKRRTTHDSQNL